MFRGSGGQSRKGNQLTQVRPAYYSSGKIAKGAKTTFGLSMFYSWLRRLLGIIVAAFIAYLVVVYGISIDPHNPKVILSSTDYHSAQSYLNFINHDLSSPLDHSKLTFATRDIVNSLKSNFPEVSGASVELPLFSRHPVIRVDISPPAIVLSTTDNKQMLVSSEGKIIGPAQNSRVGQGLIYVADQSGISENAGDQVFSSQQIDFLMSVLAQMKANRLKASYSLPAAAEEVDLHVQGLGYYVKLDMGGDGLEQSGAFLATRHYFITHHIHPSQYLDVRVTGKVFYK